jgi:predicted nucleic-acid-binding Zn-ribbon protein
MKSDMKGKKCEKCKKGKYEETSQLDDLKGVLHCIKCGHEIDRYTINYDRK